MLDQIQDTQHKVRKPYEILVAFFWDYLMSHLTHLLHVQQKSKHI